MNSIDPWNQAPEWIRLPDVCRWLVHRFGFNATDPLLVTSIIEAVRFGFLLHRIDGYLVREYAIPLACAIDTEGAPGGPRVVVQDWGSIVVDWKEGVILGGPDRDVPFQIMVWWGSAVSWGAAYLETLSPQFIRPASPCKPGDLPNPLNEFATGHGITKSDVGRPRSKAREEFNREAIRAANLDGFESRSEMRKHMSDWTDTHLAKSVDARTIRRWLEELYPEDLP